MNEVLQIKRQEREERTLRSNKRSSSGSTTRVQPFELCNVSGKGPLPRFTSYVPKQSQLGTKNSVQSATLIDKMPGSNVEEVAKHEFVPFSNFGTQKNEASQEEDSDSDSSAIARGLEEIADYKVLDTMISFPTDIRRQELKERSGKRKWLARNIPLDWSLRTKAKLEANADLSWLKQSFEKGLIPTESVLWNPSDTSKSFDSPSCDELDPWGITARTQSNHLSKHRQSHFSSECLLSSMLYWAHPSTDLPQEWYSGSEDVLRNALAMFPMQVKPIVGKSVSRIRFFLRRILEWEQAFRSLYFAFRKGKCPYFYMQYYQHNILWRLVGEDQIPCAFVSKCLGKFCTKLQNEGIKFDILPNDEAVDKVLDEVEEQDIPRKKSRSEKAFSVVVHGQKDVHALFNFLLDCQSTVSNTKLIQEDLPSLISPNTFLNASLKKLELTTFAKVRKSSAPEKISLMEITGPLLPTMLQKMCVSIQGMLHDRCCAKETEESTIAKKEEVKNLQQNYAVLHLESEKDTACFNTPVGFQAGHIVMNDRNISEAVGVELEQLSSGEMLKEISFACTKATDDEKDENVLELTTVRVAPS